MQLKVADLTEELRIVTAQCNRTEPEALRDILLYKRDKNNEIKSLKKQLATYKDQIETYDQKCSMLKQTVEKLRKQGTSLKDTPEMKTQIRAIQIEKAIEIGKLRGALSKEKVNMETEIKILQDEIRRLKQTKSGKESKDDSDKKTKQEPWMCRMNMDREEHSSPAFQKLQRERNILRSQITDQNLQLSEANLRLQTCTKIEIQNGFLRKENEALKAKIEKEALLNLPEKYNVLMNKYNTLEARFAELNRKTSTVSEELVDYEEMVESNSGSKRKNADQSEKSETDCKIIKIE